MAKPSPSNGDAATASAKSNKDNVAPKTKGTSLAKDANIAQELSYEEARTALELSLAQLQASDLPVEEMVDLYQRAKAYAERCEAVLDTVEQTVRLWDSSVPDQPAIPYSP